MTWPPSRFGLSEYMDSLWRRGGKKLCKNCDRPIYYDVDSTYWVHAEHGKVDGHNGLHCNPESWDERAKQTPDRSRIMYAEPRVKVLA